MSPLMPEKQSKYRTRIGWIEVVPVPHRMTGSVRIRGRLLRSIRRIFAVVGVQPRRPMPQRDRDDLHERDLRHDHAQFFQHIDWCSLEGGLGFVVAVLEHVS